MRNGRGSEHDRGYLERRGIAAFHALLFALAEIDVVASGKRGERRIKW